MGKLGIIGGLGPAATARLMARIVDFTQADCDQDHLEVVMISRPTIPDRTSFLLGDPQAPSFIGPMQEVARELVGMGCDVLATPCNTAHARLEEIAEAVPEARFVSMPGSLARIAAACGCEKAGVLATDGALRVGVYDHALSACGLRATAPSEANQALVMDVIYRQVKRGQIPPFEALQPACAELVGQQGADALVLGCTELSLIERPARYEGALILDALDALAYACVRACGAPARADEVRRAFGSMDAEQGEALCADSLAS